jgi:membrane-bound metal-dependent hydrolase YbcI (DUF457 family)
MNGASHRLVGGIVGGLAYTLGCKAFGVEPTLPGLAISVGVGVAGASLHDLVEPAIHPNHRAFFHSVVFNGLLAASVRRVCCDPVLPPGQKMLIAAIGLGCLSHPCLDAFTPKGLPII